ncbi:MAG: long-chain fatty acid--CoA ligase [Bifidobacteriaceae bacterium]|jgi:long-chain acyl-CoA synthetase|nr:long-chain fatty acid--CoA ligase [Bifidobacteriaceae bacterium]
MKNSENIAKNSAEVKEMIADVAGKAAQSAASSVVSISDAVRTVAKEFLDRHTGSDFGEIKSETLCTVLDERAERQPDIELVQYKLSNGEWVTKTATEMRDDVRKVAKGLIAKGVKAGDKVGIISHTSYEWIVLDYAILTVGAVTIPVYETASIEQIKYILGITEVSYLFVENSELYNTVNIVADSLPKLKKVYIIVDGGFESIIASGVLVTDDELFARRDAVKPSDIATIVFTSGSTGMPKGVTLTHEAFISCARGAREILPEILSDPEGTFLLFLPLAHILARFVTALVFMSNVTMGVSCNLKTLLTDLHKIQPTFFLGVPRVFEKVYNAASQKAGKGIKGAIFRRATKVAIEYSLLTHSATDKVRDAVGDNANSNDANNLELPLQLRIEHKLYSKLVYSQLHEALGGKIKYCISGAAPLNTNTNHYFSGAGITVLEGYGLTETSAPVSLNQVHNLRIGSVGLPLPNVDFRISDDGEILVKTPSIFTDYFKDPEATRDAFTADGYYKTGDLGKLDADGFLYITGRKKNLVVTAGGKNVAPEPLEQEIEKNSLVDSAVVVGDKKPFIGALITLDTESLPAWLRENNLPTSMSLKDAATNAAVRAHVNRAILDANKLVSRAESIRKFVILPATFTIADGTLTPSQKVSRPNVLEKYSGVIENEIYKR